MNRLKELRLAKRLKLREAARILGMPPSTMTKHETGDMEMDALAIDRYRRLYNVRPLELWLTAEQIEHFFPGMVESWRAQDLRKKRPILEEPDGPEPDPDYAGDLVPMDDDVVSPEILDLRAARERAEAWKRQGTQTS